LTEEARLNKSFDRFRAGAWLFVALTGSWVGCGAPQATAARYPAAAEKWFTRARDSYRQVDLEDAALAIDNSLRVTPDRAEVRLLGARIALARLEYDRCLELVRGLTTAEARGLRARALWYAGRLEQAADELEQLLADPEVRDPWARDIAKLARHGAGRHPFEMSGGLLAAVEMPRVAGTALVVPLEVNGEGALAMIATNVSEAVIDGAADGDPSWVSLRFGERVEVKDVPALHRDLSGVSRQLNAPVKLLVGVNLLRHLHSTIDLAGAQFVVRRTDPPPPPYATTLKLHYLRGGGMVLRGALRAEKDAPLAALMVDTSVTYPLALDAGGWKKAGIPADKLNPVPNSSTLKQAIVPMVRVGAFEVAQVLGVTGAPMGDLEKSLDVDLDGLVGSGLLAAFRVTLVDEGRTMWLEPMPPVPPQQTQSSSPSEASPFDSFAPEFDDSDAEDDAADETPAPGKGRTPAKPAAAAGKKPAAPAPKAEPPKTVPQAPASPPPKNAPPSVNAPPAGR
jgi:hypothetical protein